MVKKRVHEYATEHKVSSKTVLDKAKELGIDFNSHMSIMEDSDISKLNKSIQTSAAAKGDAKPQTPPTANKQNKPATNQKINATDQSKQNDKRELSKDKNVKTQSAQPSQSKPSNQSSPAEKQTHASSAQNKNTNTSRPAKTASQTGQTSPNTKTNRVESVSPNKSNNKPAHTNAPSSATPNRPAYGQSAGGSNQRSSNKGRSTSPYNKNRRSKFKKGTAKQGPAVPPRKFRELPETFVYTEGMSVLDVAKKLHREPAEIIKKLFLMNVMVTQNQELGKEALELLAADYGI